MIKVLVLGHVGKPVGGLSIYYNSFLKSSIKEKVNLSFIDTMSGTNTFAERGVISLRNIINAVKLTSQYIQTLVNFKPDLVDIATAYNLSFLKNSIFIIIAKIFKVKIILRPRCSLQMILPTTKSLLWKNYTLWVLKKCDGIIVLSLEWERLKTIIPNVNIVLFPNAINLSSFSAIDRIQEIEKKEVMILFFGHIGNEKGINELIDAISIINSSCHEVFSVQIVGESLQETELLNCKKKISELELDNVIKIYPPAYDHEKMRYFTTSDIFVLPSYHEGMPISIIEAMASALSIVATSVGGIPDMIQNGLTGLLIPPKDSKALAHALYQLISSPDLRISLGVAARKKATSEYEIEDQIDEMVKYYSSILYQ